MTWDRTVRIDYAFTVLSYGKRRVRDRFGSLPEVIAAAQLGVVRIAALRWSDFRRRKPRDLRLLCRSAATPRLLLQ